MLVGRLHACCDADDFVTPLPPLRRCDAARRALGVGRQSLMASYSQSDVSSRGSINNSSPISEASYAACWMPLYLRTPAGWPGNSTSSAVAVAVAAGATAVDDDGNDTRDDRYKQETQRIDRTTANDGQDDHDGEVRQDEGQDGAHADQGTPGRSSRFRPDGLKTFAVALSCEKQPSSTVHRSHLARGAGSVPHGARSTQLRAYPVRPMVVRRLPLRLTTQPAAQRAGGPGRFAKAISRWCDAAVWTTKELTHGPQYGSSHMSVLGRFEGNVQTSSIEWSLCTMNESQHRPPTQRTVTRVSLPTASEC